jgi:DNA-binding CsgD family transcriptional regulator
VTASLLVPSGEETVRVTGVFPTLRGETGIVFVGSRRVDFPTDLERFLLQAAVGQAAVSVHVARLLARERAARAEAEAAVHSRNAFLATLSHDLRTPLTAISECAAHAIAYAADPRPSRTRPEEAATHVGAEPAPASAIAPPTVALARLTLRESEVLGLLAQGLTNKEIGAALWLSDRTVERHITGLYRKIGAQRRTEATAFALRHGLSGPEPADHPSLPLHGAGFPPRKLGGLPEDDAFLRA